MSIKAKTKLSLVFLILVLPLAVQGAKEKPSEATIWPGESYTFENVTVTWKSPAKEKAESSFGELTFETPGQKSWTVELKENTQAYFNDVDFQFGLRIHERPNVRDVPGIVPGVNLWIRSKREPSTRFLDSKAGNAWMPVSFVCPITVNDWEFRVSEKMQPYADGGEYFQLLGQNKKTGEKKTIPCQRGAKRKFGRFQITVGGLCQWTRSMSLSIERERDLTQRGRGAYVKELWAHQRDTHETFFERMSERYGFEVEWLHAETHPEAIESLKEYQYPKGLKYTNSVIGNILQSHFEQLRNMRPTEPRAALKLTWIDETHLQIEPEDIEKIEAQIEEDKERRRKEEEAEALFKKEYKLVTRVYKLRSIGAASAKALVERELSTHCLYGGGSIRSKPDLDVDEEELKRHRSQAWAVAQEKAIADEGQNALLVMAIPATHDKIELLLARTDAVLSMKAKNDSVANQYRIELILLRGGKAGEAVGRGRFSRTTTFTDPKTGEKVTESQVAVSGATYTEGDVYSAELAKQNGIGKEDMELFGFDGVAELGKALVALHGEKGAVGQAVVALPNGYRCQLSFEDEREPYLVVKCSLLGGEKKPQSRFKPKKEPSLFKEDEVPTNESTPPATESAEPLLENTLFLKANEPTLLGLTNLREALILVLRLRDTPR